jgi:hypothetical protein
MSGVVPTVAPDIQTVNETLKIIWNPNYSPAKTTVTPT